MSTSPNVLFILADDQRYGTVGALGNPEIKTPNLDRLCARGTAFTNAYIPGGTTGAVCMPSRAMLNSGRSLFHIVGNGEEIPPEHTTLAEAFRAGGYQTYEVGKWHNGPASFARGFEGGENIFFGGMWDHWNVPVNHFHEDGKYDRFIPFNPDFSSGSSATVSVRAELIHAGYHSTELFCDTMVKFIEDYDGSRPFYAYLSFLAPHDPRTMPERFRNMYDPDKITLPPNYMEMPVVNCGWSNRGRDEVVEEYPRRPERIRQHMADYYAMISHIDENVGNVLAALEKKGILDNTIIVYAGDNGLAIGQHGLMGKQNIYEHSVKVPLILAGPGIPAGQIREQFVYLFDIFPTLCALTGTPVPASVEGRDFSPMFRDPAYVTREDLYFAFQARIRGVRDARYKLIEYRTENLKLTQLFDLQTDPYETRNFFDIAGYEEITDRLRRRLFEYRDAWDDDKSKYGAQFWQAYRQYDEAVVHGVDQPKGKTLAKQLASLK